MVKGRSIKGFSLWSFRDSVEVDAGSLARYTVFLGVRNTQEVSGDSMARVSRYLNRISYKIYRSDRAWDIHRRRGAGQILYISRLVNYIGKNASPVKGIHCVCVLLVKYEWNHDVPAPRPPSPETLVYGSRLTCKMISANKTPDHESATVSTILAPVIEETRPHLNWDKG